MDSHRQVDLIVLKHLTLLSHHSLFKLEFYHTIINYYGILLHVQVQHKLLEYSYVSSYTCKSDMHIMCVL